MTLSEKTDLVKFIHQESLIEKKQSEQVIIETYACTLWKGFFDMKHKLYNIKNLNNVNALEMGIQLVDNLFWIIFHYSSNLQLTLFLTERGRLLYTEFLSMSRSHQLMKQLNKYPSIYEGFQFAITKSIGSLICKNHHTKIKIKSISVYRNIYRNIFRLLNHKYLTNKDDIIWSDDQVNITLHNLNHHISIAVHKSPKMIEKFLFLPSLKNLSLSPFLLILQLMSDTISNKNCISFSFIDDIFSFINKNKIYMENNSLKCLNKDHIIQHHWRIERNKDLTNNCKNYELE